MFWVTDQNLPDYIARLSNPPLTEVLQQYDNTVSFKFGKEKVDTTIVSSKNWLQPNERPTFKIKEEENKRILTKELSDLTKILAFQQNNNKSDIKPDEYMWNGQTYIINSSLSLNEFPKEIELEISDFFSVVSHTSNLIGGVLEEDFNSERDNLFDKSEDLAENIGSYHRPIGGTYITVVLGPDDVYYLLVGQRSEEVVFWPNMVTAFPAGYFRPTNISYDDLITQNMLAEYAKETLDTTLELQYNDSRGVHAINQLLRAGKADFTITGFGLEAFTVSAELTGVLLIEYPDYTEYLFENLEDSYDLDHIHAIPLKDSMDEKFKELFSKENLTPQTAFALGTGLQYLDENTDVSVPFDISTLLEN